MKAASSFFRYSCPLLMFVMLFAFCLDATALAADTWYVASGGDDTNGGTSFEDAFATIQMGVDTALDGDTVLVADGTYTGEGNYDIDFGVDSKNLVVKSLHGPKNCSIDCQGLGRAFYFNWSQTSDTVIDGFTIVNGNTNASLSYGGAIQCQQGYPII
jgi:hypothetical protein